MSGTLPTELAAHEGDKYTPGAPRGLRTVAPGCSAVAGAFPSKTLKTPDCDGL